MGTGWPRSTSSAARSSASASSASWCQDVCHVMRDHEENKTDTFAGPRFFARTAELEMHPADVNWTGASWLRQEQGPGQVQHHQVLHRGLPRAHQDHRQRHHPSEGAGGGRLLRPDRLAGAQDPQPHQKHGRRGGGPLAGRRSGRLHNLRRRYTASPLRSSTGPCPLRRFRPWRNPSRWRRPRQTARHR